MVYGSRFVLVYVIAGIGKHSPYAKYRGGEHEELGDEIQDGVVYLSGGRYNERCEGKAYGGDEGSHGYAGLDFCDGFHGFGAPVAPVLV